MHAARIDTKSKPAQLFRLLRHGRKRWDAAALARCIGGTTCLSTHIAAVRQRARAFGMTVVCHRKHTTAGCLNEYELIKLVG